MNRRELLKSSILSLILGPAIAGRVWADDEGEAEPQEVVLSCHDPARLPVVRVNHSGSGSAAAMSIIGVTASGAHVEVDAPLTVADGDKVWAEFDGWYGDDVTLVLHRA